MNVRHIHKTEITKKNVRRVTTVTGFSFGRTRTIYWYSVK